MAGAFVFSSLPPGAKAIWGGRMRPGTPTYANLPTLAPNRFLNVEADLTVNFREVIIGETGQALVK